MAPGKERSSGDGARKSKSVCVHVHMGVHKEPLLGVRLPKKSLIISHSQAGA